MRFAGVGHVLSPFVKNDVRAIWLTAFGPVWWRAGTWGFLLYGRSLAGSRHMHVIGLGHGEKWCLIANQ
jgi:hypothetical protein